MTRFKNSTLLFLIIFFLNQVFTEEIKLLIETKKNPNQIVLLDQNIDEIHNFKLNLYASIKDVIIKKQHHPGVILNLFGLEDFLKLEKLELIYTFHKQNNLNFIKSNSLKTLFISSGVTLENIDFLKNVPKLKALGLNWIQLDVKELDLRNTNIEYLELSDIPTKLPIIYLPESLRILNLTRSIDKKDSLNFIQDPQNRKLIKNKITHKINTISVLFDNEILYEKYPEYIMRIP